VVSIFSLDVVQEKKGKQSMEANSRNSAPKDKRRITKTLPLTLGEALEILTRGFYIVEEAGGVALDVEEIAPGELVVKLHGVTLADGLLTPLTSSPAQEDQQ
jgi:hypothetical protein